MFTNLAIERGHHLVGEDLNPQALARSIGLDGKPPPFAPEIRSDQIVRPGFPVLKADVLRLTLWILWETYKKL